MPHQRISIQQQPLQSFQLFTYGSGQIWNSCHTDKFLESLFESFIRQISPISLREQGNFHTIKDDTVEFLAKQHNKWIQKFSSGKNGINFSDIWCTITRNVEQRKACTFHETFPDHSMLKKCTPSVLLYHSQQSLLPTQRQYQHHGHLKFSLWSSKYCLSGH